MTSAALAVIGFTIVLTSFISAVFGMAGGMVLLGVLLVYLDVASRHGAVLDHPVRGQRLAGGALARLRALADLLLVCRRRAARVRIMWTIAYVPDKASVYLLLGVMPFVDRSPAGRHAAQHRVARRAVRHRLSDHDRAVLSGVGGMFLDIFFHKSMLDRKTTIATKAMTQTFSHVVRGVYFGTLAGIGDLRFDRGAGGRAGDRRRLAAPFVLERMTDHGFRQWTRALIMTISRVYLVRAGMLFWRG